MVSELTLPPRRTFTKKQRRVFILKRGMTCAYCKKQGTEDKGPDGRTWHIDHFVPYSRTGNSDDSNLRLACAHCNLSKKNGRDKRFVQPSELHWWEELDAGIMQISFEAELPIRAELRRRAALQGVTLPTFTTELMVRALQKDITLTEECLRYGRSNPLSNGVRLFAYLPRDLWLKVQYAAIYLNTTGGPVVLALIERQLMVEEADQ